MIGRTAPALHGVTVIDLTTFLSGPFATQLLADLGADVIKVEEPAGDSSRTIPPHFIDGDSAYFLTNNRGKRSIVVDLKTAAGLDVVQRLIARADIVIENYRPGVAERLGVNRRALMARHPRLIWASITGFGQDGPWRDRPAYDMIVQALSGVMSLTGESGRPAVRLGIPAGDVVAGMFATIGVLAALGDVRRGGRGRRVDVAMLDSMLSMLSYQAVYALVSGTTPGRQNARHDSIPTYRTFVAADGKELVVTANTERMWRDLCTALDLTELVEDGRFLTNALRLQHKAQLWTLLESRFLEADAHVWVERLIANGVPAAPIKDVTEALADAVAFKSGMVSELADAERGVVRVISSPIRLDDEVGISMRFPPRLGQHTDEILTQAGLTTSDIAELRQAGAVG